GYRFMLNEGGELPVYLTPTVGLVGGYERWWETPSHEVITDSPCSTLQPCNVESWTETRTLDMIYLRPSIGVALQLGPGEIGYTLQLDVDKPGNSTHQWYLGLQF